MRGGKMKSIKAIVIDIDGTIYYHHTHDILQSTQKALIALKAKGYKIIVATSRCYAETANLPNFFHQFPFDGYIYDGGAIAYINDMCVKETYIPKHIIKQLLVYADQNDYALRYATKDQNYLLKKYPQYIYDGFFHLYLTIPQIKKYEDEHVSNILLYTDTIDESLQQILDEISFVKHGNVVEITAKNTNKIDGIETLLKEMDLNTDNILCIGDGYNDIEMVKQAHIGVAMGNSSSQLQKVANVVTKSIDQHGFYEYFKQHGFID